MLPDISPTAETVKPSANAVAKPPTVATVSPRNTLNSSSGLVIAYNDLATGAKAAPALPPKDGIVFSRGHC
jgi:hypothetical protein